MNIATIFLFVLVGFSIGDELGFSQSLSNLESAKRRSVKTQKLNGLVSNSLNMANARETSVRTTESIKSYQEIPPFRPLPLGTQPLTKQPAVMNLTVYKIPFIHQEVAKPFHQQQQLHQETNLKQNMQQDTLALQMLKQQRLQQQQQVIATQSTKNHMIPLPLPSDEMAASVNEMTLLSLQPITAEINELPTQQNEKRQSSSYLSSMESIQKMKTSLKDLAEASNITLEALEAAILLKQQQFLKKHQETITTSTSTTTTTATPLKNVYNFEATKVMNAPREYYPVGYDRNFDDNFASRVDLPETSFYCGDQKHFPGLYADEDLGCMVFHVCALTDNGLIMKSFLCPESTLFDQSILKCNWWFYVDCKASKSLYDSNIPISKSYQLMKALAFFSAYKNPDNTSNIHENEDKS